MKLSLEEWLELMRGRPENTVFTANHFPTEEHRLEWLRTAHERPEEDVRLLLRRFLISTGSNQIDRINARLLAETAGRRAQERPFSEHDLRLLRHYASSFEYPVWEGVGWVVDLAPSSPRKAIDVLNAFFEVYCQKLNDGYISGLFDALAIIRNRYIESPQTADSATKALDALSWRDLEWLCAVLYRKMGYEVAVTPRSDDDGVDVLARKTEQGKTELVVVQAKKWSLSNPVGKSDLRELLGTVTHHSATKGVIVTTGRYESGATTMANGDARLEAIGRDDLARLLNEHCGSDWHSKVDRLIMWEKHSQAREEHDAVVC